MSVPGSFPEVLFFIVLIVPGVAYSLARRMVVGWQSPDHGAAARLFEALFVSLVFDAIYLLVLLSVLGWTGDNAIERAEELIGALPGGVVALTMIVLLLLVPAAVGYLIPARLKVLHVTTKSGRQRSKVHQVNRSRSTPRAWDHAAFRAYEPCFVRVRTEDGRYYGGWFDADSLVSTYPFSRDIFIAVAWNMGEFGEFESEAPNTRGVWIPVTDGCIVEWIDPPSTNGEE